jgi:hypothetical protein
MPRGHLLAISALALSGCWSNVATPFPEGLMAWEDNTATLPEPAGTDACPEMLSMVNTRYGGRPAVHAKGCIHSPIAQVWRSVRDPQTGRDPTTTDGFRVEEYETEPEYDYSYRTYVHISSGAFQFEFNAGWRHGLVEGSDQAPAVTATRWQKVFGTELFSVMEGSLILRPHPSDPNITVAEYQYHLDGTGVDHGRIQSFLSVIYGRLRDRANGVALSPDDCGNCATPPEGY